MEVLKIIKILILERLAESIIKEKNMRKIKKKLGKSKILIKLNSAINYNNKLTIKLNFSIDIYRKLISAFIICLLIFFLWFFWTFLYRGVRSEFTWRHVFWVLGNDSGRGVMASHFQALTGSLQVKRVPVRDYGP